MSIVGSKTIFTSITIFTCATDGCGVMYGLEDGFVARRRDDHKSWNCPNGHHQHFPQKNVEELLRQELANEKESVEYLRKANDRLHTNITQLNYSIRAQKAAKTKIMNRVKNGNCPCCKRTFSNLQAHFKTVHPELLENNLSPIHATINKRANGKDKK